MVKGGGRRRSSPAALPDPETLVARVLPDVAGIDKQFDYTVPAGAAAVRAGSLVRIDLHGRRVGGWVTEVGVDPPPGLALVPVAKVRGWGPEASVVDLAQWAAWRWASRRGFFLTTASAPFAVPFLPPPALRPPAPPAGLPVALDDLAVDRPVVLRLPPATDVTPVVAEMARRGPALVVVPTVARAGVLADRLRRAGGDVALLPADWAQARAGAGVVVGPRSAAWGPCPDVSSVVVVDGHDEGLGQEGAPTWHASVVAAERARRAEVPCVITSPCPTLELLEAGELRTADPGVERAGWTALEVVDRRVDDPRLGLYSEALGSLLRTVPRVVCVLNRTGRVRLLACSVCESIARCERCGAALRTSDAGALACPRCGLERPKVCAECGSISLRQLRIGVSRAREELEALARRPVGEVTASTRELPSADLLVGTEAVLRRLDRRWSAGAVAFLDFDQELLAPRVRAGEEALALLALASRLVGGRSGRVMVQTRSPDHPVVRAALLADPSVLADDERRVREALRLPPFTSVALVSGPAAGEYVAQLAGVEVLGPDGDEWMVKAPDVATLADALLAVPRPAGKLRVAVDPPRF